jgi:hypothetical protein
MIRHAPTPPRRLRKLAALCGALAAAAACLARLWEPLKNPPTRITKQRHRAPHPPAPVVTKQRRRALPLAAVHTVYRAYENDYAVESEVTRIEAHLDTALPCVPRRSFASLGRGNEGYRAALEAIAASGHDDGYVLVLVPKYFEEDVLAEVSPLLHAAAFPHLRGVDHVSAGCGANCGPTSPLAEPPPMARSWPPVPAEELCFEAYSARSGPRDADARTGIFTRRGARRYLAAAPGGLNAPSRCISCSLRSEEWACATARPQWSHLREVDVVASERQLRLLKVTSSVVPRVTLYQVFRRPVPADIVARNLA